MTENEARRTAVRLLESEGYEISDVTRGQGRPRLSVVELKKKGSRQLCSIKVADKSVNGRISYPFQDGKFTVLCDVDLVLHVHPTMDGSIHATMFSKASVLAAFEKGRKALVDAGKEHLPVWVSPVPESGWRQVGSGFGQHALWEKTVPPGGPVSIATSDAKGDSLSTGIRPLSIAEAKVAVAAKYDVSPDNVEIIVRG
jgi:hypothetical protein